MWAGKWPVSLVSPFLGTFVQSECKVLCGQPGVTIAMNYHKSLPDLQKLLALPFFGGKNTILVHAGTSLPSPKSLPCKSIIDRHVLPRAKAE